MIDMDLARLEKLGADPKVLAESQVLFLPENYDRTSDQEALMDVGQAAELSKLLRAAGIRSVTTYDINVNADIIMRRGVGLWLGIVWIKDHLILPVFVKVVSDWLSAPLKRDGKRTVHLELRMQRGNDKVRFEYEGDARTLVKVLQSLDQGEDRNDE